MIFVTLMHRQLQEIYPLNFFLTLAILHLVYFSFARIDRAQRLSHAASKTIVQLCTIIMNICLQTKFVNNFFLESPFLSLVQAISSLVETRHFVRGRWRTWVDRKRLNEISIMNWFPWHNLLKRRQRCITAEIPDEIPFSSNRETERWKR